MPNLQKTIEQMFGDGYAQEVQSICQPVVSVPKNVEFKQKFKKRDKTEAKLIRDRALRQGKPELIHKQAVTNTYNIPQDQYANAKDVL